MPEVKYFTWDEEKNEKLKAQRGVSFEEIVFHIERGAILDILEHPNQERYGGQRIFVVQREGYAYLVPFVEKKEQVVLRRSSRAVRRQRSTWARRPPMTKLDSKEKELLDSVERGEWRSVRRLKGERRRYGCYAAATFRKDRRVNIRISTKDLETIQKRALEEGLPYQTLISSLLHKYVAGRLRGV